MNIRTKQNIKYGLIGLCLMGFVGVKVKNKLSPDVDDSALRIVSYNVENLFDTEDNPRTNDDDFTPEGRMHWTDSRLTRKIDDLSKVLLSVGDGKAPSIIGLCEIENGDVVEALISNTQLKDEKSKYIVTDSQDPRGINVGLVYQPQLFTLLENHSYRPNIGEPADPKYSRDILHAVGKVASGDTLDILVCHFPARGGGVEKTEVYRMIVAAMLKQKTDSLTRVRGNANIIAMGDFNDTPRDRSMSKTLSAMAINNSPDQSQLYNLYLKAETASNHPKVLGSYKYKDDWDFYDQFVVSGQLLKADSHIKVKNNEAYAFADDFMLQNDRKHGGKKPYRLYSGLKYIEGISDHLPIYLDLEISKPAN